MTWMISERALKENAEPYEGEGVRRCEGKNGKVEQVVGVYPN
jgi:hypothetical protein